MRNPYTTKAFSEIISSLYQPVTHGPATSDKEKEYHERALNIAKMILENLNSKAYENLGKLYREDEGISLVYLLFFFLPAMIGIHSKSDKYLDAISILVNILNNAKLDYIREFAKEIGEIVTTSQRLGKFIDGLREDPVRTIKDITKEVALDTRYKTREFL